MSAFQALATRVTGDEEEGDPATVKAADRVALAVTGGPVPDRYRPASGEVVHYLLGATLGAAYGLAAEYRPGIGVGFGNAYGVAAALLLDDAAVPAAGLGPPPWRTSAGTHGYALASHLVFGTVLEGTRALLGRRR